MNARRLIIVIAMSLACICARARAPFLRYGIEWGFNPNVFAKTQLNYLTSEGYRVIDNTDRGDFFPCGFIMANIGINAWEYMSVSVHSGYMGVSRNNRVIPLLLRVTGHINGSQKDGMFVFLDGGVGFHLPKTDEPPRKLGVTGDAGIGYRLRLSSGMSLDLSFCIKGFYDRPLIKDPDTGQYVPEEDIFKSDAFYLNPSVSVGLTF